MAIKIPQISSTASTKPQSSFSTVDRTFNMVDNYVYLYHTGTFIVLPSYPESVNDSMGASFATTTPLARSAPIFSYQNSGPRVVSINLRLQRELMTQINWQKSNAPVSLNDDYVDTLIKQVQAAVVPKYSASAKMVDPPLVAVRFGDDIFIKGVVNGNVSLTYNLPIIQDKSGKDKYSVVDLSFSVTEVDPYDAESVMLAGSFRGLSTTLERNLWQTSTSSAQSTSSYGNASSSIATNSNLTQNIVRY